MTSAPLIDLIAGARPNFMKIAPIIDALQAARARGAAVRFRLVHTGQHYDRTMSGSFFEQLGLPDPDVNLEVGSGTAAEQTAAIMTRYEQVLLREKSALCVVVGDVTSTMACAITAQKLGVPVAHVEGGLRSGDWSMPEEINRLVTDAITNYFFTTTEGANAQLRSNGVGGERIFFVGNTMIDTLLKHRPRFQAPPVWTHAGLRPQGFLVLTLHRPANVDDEDRLRGLMAEVMRGACGRPVVFPVHPRTAKTLQRIGVTAPNLHLTEPLSYLEFNFLVERAQAVITDSGGVTEETTVLGVPCLTLRDTTERPETVALGTNELIGSDPVALHPYLEKLYAGGWKRGAIPPRWDGFAGERIVTHLLERLGVSSGSVESAP
ncbi:non-hydrolyzing UDP-N-acetylglucosamine 2-epimerase [Horticoccus sp. 23ND18S-11]|uniref:non-hydrolyzing UDP-N-acetylglucosamine 2-epimerase n=1 Tax=Horticoccus sp. 23ND18S-11 TaxID=3391832 RepID=UPI0039C9A5D9